MTTPPEARIDALHAASKLRKAEAIEIAREKRITEADQEEQRYKDARRLSTNPHGD